MAPSRSDVYILRRKKTAHPRDTAMGRGFSPRLNEPRAREARQRAGAFCGDPNNFA